MPQGEDSVIIFLLTIPLRQENLMGSTVTFALLLLFLSLFPGRAAGAGPGDEGTEADTKILEMAAEIEKRVAAIRGLKLKRPVGKGIYTREQLKGFILESFEKELPDEKAASWAASLKMFGMIPREMELKKTFIDFLVSQVGGFYDPEKKCLNCISTKLSIIAHIVMAHEILHSFQDQYVDLQGYYKDVEFNNDILGARQAVIEGEAQHLTTLYAQRHPAEMAAELAGARPADLGVFALQQFAASSGAPPYLMETMTFPYIVGERFIKTALRRGGWGAVDDLYRLPPHSTEQIAHPEKFFENRDEPVKIVLPGAEDLFGCDESKEWEKFDENTLGELQVKILIKLTADPIRAMRASVGWDGDTYVLYRRKKTEEDVMIWALTFDSVKDAEEFFDAEAKGLRLKYEARRTEGEGGGHGILQGSDGDGSLAFFLDGNDKIAFLETRGKDVLVLDNFPVAGDLLGRARSAAWKFRKEEFDFHTLEPVPPVK
jgi:hypothetical protein